jgi:hypothetical protein
MHSGAVVDAARGRPGQADPRPAEHSAHGDRDRPPAGTHTLAALLVAVILLQRVGLPIGGMPLPIVVPVGLAVAAWLVVRGALRPERLRTVLFVAAVGAISLASWGATWWTPNVRSTALLLVLVVCSPWVLHAGAGARNVVGARVVGVVFVRLMTVLAGVGVAQMAAQVAGLWRYRDVLLTVIPESLSMGDYNTSQPIAWDSAIYKSQAFVFLEASIFSQMTALAIVVALLLRQPWWQLLILGLGLLTALSGTGLILLAAGLVLVAVRARSVLRPGYLLVAAAAVAVALVSPAGDILASRTAEASDPTSSLGLRFVLPYEQVAAGMAEEPMRWLVGAGPGTSERVLESDRDAAGLAVVYTVPTKLIFEYGLLAGCLFLLFLLVALLRAPPFVVLPGTLVVLLALLGGYLGSPHAMWVAWLLSVVWGRGDE